VVALTIKILGKRNMWKYLILAAIFVPTTAGIGVAAIVVPSTAMCAVASAVYSLSGVVVGGKYIQGGTRALMKNILARWIVDVVKDMREKGFLPDRFIEKAESLRLLGVRRRLDERIKNGVPEVKTSDGSIAVDLQK
jgi:uncharacterized membrane protein YfbV (UPF0208 family)